MELDLSNALSGGNSFNVTEIAAVQSFSNMINLIEEIRELDGIILVDPN